MMGRYICIVVSTLALLAAVTADTATNNREDRTAQVLSAAQSSIARAVSSGGSSNATRQAELKGMDTAKLTTHAATDSWEFGGRKLLEGAATNSRSDRISQALSAAQASIARSVTSGGKLESTFTASKNGMTYAKLATQESAQPGDFGGKRKLLSGGATNSRSDRIAQALSAAQASIARSVTSGGKLDSTISASRDGVAYARLATQESAEPGDFGGKRKLLDTAANTNSDLIAQAMNAAHDAVTRAVSGTSDAQTAASKNMAYSKLTTKLSARPWEFGGKRKLLDEDKTTNTNGDRITQALNAAQDAIGKGASGAGARWAAAKNMVYSKLTTKMSATPWEIDGGRKLLSDRVSQSITAAHEAMKLAVSLPKGAQTASKKNLEYSKLTTMHAADPWQFDQP